VLRRLVGDPERRVADGQFGDHLRMLVGPAHPVALDGAERCLVELDRLAAAPHRELRRDCHSSQSVLT
jgi:hypothetical protein